MLPSPETVSLSFPFLSLRLFRYITMLIGTILRRHYLPPHLQWYQSIAGGAATEDSAHLELIVSFGV